MSIFSGITGMLSGLFQLLLRLLPLKQQSELERAHEERERNKRAIDQALPRLPRNPGDGV